MERKYDLSVIFVYQYQRNLRQKIRDKDKSLRVIAIPEFSEFFMPSITVEEALSFYRDLKGKSMVSKKYTTGALTVNSGEFDQWIISICRNCHKEDFRPDRGLESDRVPEGWIDDPDVESDIPHLYCSEECFKNRGTRK